VAAQKPAWMVSDRGAILCPAGWAGLSQAGLTLDRQLTTVGPRLRALRAVTGLGPRRLRRA